MSLVGGGLFEESTTITLQNGDLSQGVTDTELGGDTVCTHGGGGGGGGGENSSVST